MYSYTSIWTLFGIRYLCWNQFNLKFLCVFFYVVSMSIRFLEGGGPGDFTIQGATDGDTNFRIQGATDGHSNFQIQGPTDGGSATYNVQGPIDRYGQSTIQEAYDANEANAKALQYNDPSGIVINFVLQAFVSECIESTYHEYASKGYRVNWRSYDRQTRPQAQAEPQYTAQAAAPIPRASPRQRAHQPQPQPQPQRQPQPQQPELVPNYRPYSNAPPQIQQLLQFQQQIPYINIIPEPYRYETIRTSNKIASLYLYITVLSIIYCFSQPRYTASMILNQITDSTRKPRYGLSLSRSGNTSKSWLKRRRPRLYPSPWSHPHLVKSHAVTPGANVRLNTSNRSIAGYPSRQQNRSLTTRLICHLTCANCWDTRRKRRTTSLPTRSSTVRINRMCRIA